MSMIRVMKFGGTSVGSPEAVRQVTEIVGKAAESSSLVVVVSALGGTTDALLSALEAAAAGDTVYRVDLPGLEERHMAMVRTLFRRPRRAPCYRSSNRGSTNWRPCSKGLISSGNPRQTARPVAASANCFPRDYSGLHGSLGAGRPDRRRSRPDCHRCPIRKADVDRARTAAACRERLAEPERRITVVPGFVARSRDGHQTTLGRGGSDYSAAILASVLNADRLEIWTDVNGMYTANPKWSASEALGTPDL